jgi:hypothetical protein
MFTLFMLVLMAILFFTERFLAKRSGGSKNSKKSSTPVRRVSAPRRR